MSPVGRGNTSGPSDPGPSWTNDCPPESLLRRIGDDEIAEVLYSKLERHIETCPDCQAILQDWADSDRVPAYSIDAGGFHAESSDTDEFEVVPAIPGFRLIRELGRGGEGVVHLAEESETQRLVALKFLPGGWMADPEGRSRWLRQVRATARIQHENVVRLYRIEETSRWYVMVLEYVAGGTLRDRVDRPLTPVAAATLVHRLALAVGEIHRAGIWHLDLKPSNVLLDGSESTVLENCTPKISDFGIAMRDELTANEQSHGGGTPAFMSPEQAGRGMRRLGPATDVYGLGAILYYCLTAKPPFEGTSTSESIYRVLNEPLRFPELTEVTIEPQLIAICRKAMAKSPTSRFSNPGQMAKALGQWIASNSACVSVGTETNRPVLSGKIRNARSFVTLSLIALSISLYPLARWFSSVDRDENSEPLTKTEWIQELRQVEPSVFFGPRLDRLIASSRQRTEDLLSVSTGDPEELARFGMMLQATAARFCSSLNKELFEAADDLFECAVRLLERSDELAPGNQATIRELALTEFSFGHVKDNDLEADEAAVIKKFQQDVRHFERASLWIDRIEDHRSRVHLASQILDRAREHAFNANLKGLTRAAQVWNDFHEKCETQWSDLADSEEIRLRLALFDRQEFEPRLSSVRKKDHSTLDESTRLLLERELVMYRLVPLVFRAGKVHAEPTVEEMESVLKDAEGLLKKMGRNPELIITIAYEELIRPVATVSTWLRANGNWPIAQSLANRYRIIAQALNQRYPDRFECYLALSESYLQNWKNALQAQDPAGAEAGLKVSLEMAQRATRIAPGNVKARAMLEDRESRLARFQAAR
ncbi:protein kinase [bacterium]|nr:protein kinase [bacterium]